jgi:hypothetical protein
VGKKSRQTKEKKMPYKVIIGLSPTFMSLGLVGQGAKSVGKGFKGMFSMGVSSLAGIPLISKTADIIKSL